MARVAQQLTPTEIGLVARWLSSRASPPGTRPEPPGPALPIACGSGER
jgi:hypothetical protein